ncbi:MAG: alcohol dehydrogenase catalytic domain-containing protein [Novosphingobium sp.]|nr:alcohol dehydrogenase catalytic domain-containing protein [Novosphingobium sp.]
MDITAAAVRKSGGPFAIEKVEIEGIRPDEVLVRVVGKGLCHTDLVVRAQVLPTPLPAVLGHGGRTAFDRCDKLAQNHTIAFERHPRVRRGRRRCRSADYPALAGRSLPGGRFPFDRLVTTYPLKQINQAIEDQRAGKCVEVVLPMP